MNNIFYSEEAFIKSNTRHPICKKITYRDPYELFLKLPGISFLLESGNGPETTCRYSFIGHSPYMIFESKGTSVTLKRFKNYDESGKAAVEEIETIATDPCALLESLLDEISIPRQEQLPPFVSGAVGLFGYDLVRQFEQLPDAAMDDQEMPDILLAFVDTVVVLDHYSPADSMIIHTPRDWTCSRKDIFKKGTDRLNRLAGLLDKVRDNTIDKTDEPKTSDAGEVTVNYEMSKEYYIEMVKKCQEYIAAGDIFQANLSQRISITGMNPYAAYRTLRNINSSPFCAFLDFGDLKIASSSPERLVRLNNRKVETRPIAGTRPRGSGSTEDTKLSEELITHPKERAEHIMMVDLERNDIGRVAEFGSVKVDELMVLEKYSHVIHIVSNVTGTLKKKHSNIDLLKAVFPGGTITGVPKVRCMEIINELEPVSRGAYTGSIGYISSSGDMDLNIVIRTFVFNKNHCHVQVGAGIVADSDPEKEYYETIQKGRALLETVDRLKKMKHR